MTNNNNKKQHQTKPKIALNKNSLKIYLQPTNSTPTEKKQQKIVPFRLSK
jgi:hypothetical protein